MISFTSIRGRIVTLVAVCFLVVIGTVSSIAIFNAREAALEDVTVAAEAIAQANALKIKAQFELALDSARAYAHSVQGWKISGLPMDRNVTNAMMGEIARSTPVFYGVWNVWEPDQFDGEDFSHKNTPGSDANGQYAAYWSQLSGSLSLSVTGTHNIPGKNAWYTIARDTRHEFIFPPTVYDGVMMVSMAVPILVQGQSVGVAGIDFDSAFLQTIADSVTAFDGSAKIMMVTHDNTFGMLTGEEKAVGKPVDDFVPGYTAVMQKIERDETVVERVDGVLRVSVPVRFGDTEKRWAVALSVPEEVVFAGANSMAMRILLASGICFILALILIWFIANIIAKPIVSTSVVVEDIAEGKLDSRCEVKGRDEVAGMQIAVNSMADKLQANMDEIKDHMAKAEERTRQAEIATQEAQEAKAQAESARREGMLDAADKLDAVVAEMSTSSEQLGSKVEEVSSGAAMQHERTSETAAAMEEMNATVLEVARNSGASAEAVENVRNEALSGADVVHKSVETINNVHSLTETLKGDMALLGEQAEDIGRVMNVITDIADQTNLLALNAAIEAARAGEAGRGFAVVADEVRKLAEKTMDATKEVGEAISTIQGGARRNVEDMNKAAEAVEGATSHVNESGAALGRIVSLIDSATDQVRSIATAAEQQSAASEEITAAVDDIRRISEETTEGMSQANAAIISLVELADALKGLIADLRSE